MLSADLPIPGENQMWICLERDQPTRASCAFFVRHLQRHHCFQSLSTSADHAAYPTRRWFGLPSCLCTLLAPTLGLCVSYLRPCRSSHQLRLTILLISFLFIVASNLTLLFQICGLAFFKPTFP